MKSEMKQSNNNLNGMADHNSALRPHHSALIATSELEKYLWGAAVLLRGQIDASGYKEFIFPLLFFKRICDVYDEEFQKNLEEAGGDAEFAAAQDYIIRIPEGAHWRDVRKVTENIGAKLVEAFMRIEAENPPKEIDGRLVGGLTGIFGDKTIWTNKAKMPDAIIVSLLNHFSKETLSIARCPADEMGTGYEYLVGQFANDAGHTAQEFYTNRTVVTLMAQILRPAPGESIYDPTCGSGGMLIKSLDYLKSQGLEYRSVRVYGQEVNPITSAIARMNLYLHGVTEFSIQKGDTLSEPKFIKNGQLERFNVVLANPPYSIKTWNREKFAHDVWSRNILGTPPQGRADYAFIQHILASMDEKNGRSAILLPHGVLFREEEKEIRRALLDADLLECVIGLASNLFYNSPMEACVMICRATKPKSMKRKVLFINAVNEVMRKNAESKLESQHVEKILKAYHERPSDGVFSYEATREEIAAKNDSLAISLYAHVANVSRGDAESRSLGEALGDWVEAAEALDRELNAFERLVERQTADCRG